MEGRESSSCLPLDLPLAGGSRVRYDHAKRQEFTYDERVALTREDLDGVHYQRLVTDRVGLDDRHIVPVNREREVRVARNGNKAEAVALALGDVENGEIGSSATSEAAKAIDQSSVRNPGM